MIAGEAACICAFARSIVQPGFNRPINESHHAVGCGMRFLPGSQKKGSAQSGMATSNLCPISTPKKPAAATPMTGKTLPYRIADHHTRRPAPWLVVPRLKYTAGCRGNLQQAEEVSADEKALGVACLAFLAEVERLGAPCQHIGESLLLVTYAVPEFGCEIGATRRPPAAAMRSFSKIDVCQFLGV